MFSPAPAPIPDGFSVELPCSGLQHPRGRSSAPRGLCGFPHLGDGSLACWKAAASCMVAAMEHQRLSATSWKIILPWAWG